MRMVGFLAHTQEGKEIAICLCLHVLALAVLAKSSCKQGWLAEIYTHCIFNGSLYAEEMTEAKKPAAAGNKRKADESSEEDSSEEESSDEEEKVRGCAFVSVALMLCSLSQLHSITLSWTHTLSSSYSLTLSIPGTHTYSQPAAKKAKAENGTAVKTPAPKAAAATDEPESCTVFVGNLSWNSDDSTIGEHFKDCGNVTSIRVGECVGVVCRLLLNPVVEMV